MPSGEGPGENVKLPVLGTTPDPFPLFSRDENLMQSIVQALAGLILLPLILAVGVFIMPLLALAVLCGFIGNCLWISLYPRFKDTALGRWMKEPDYNFFGG